MRRDTREWTAPRPFRALLWWPPLALALAVASPEDAVWTILLAGLALALGGGLVSALHSGPSVTDERPTVEIPRVDAAA